MELFQPQLPNFINLFAKMQQYATDLGTLSETLRGTKESHLGCLGLYIFANVRLRTSGFRAKFKTEKMFEK